MPATPWGSPGAARLSPSAAGAWAVRVCPVSAPCLSVSVPCPLAARAAAAPARRSGALCSRWAGAPAGAAEHGGQRESLILPETAVFVRLTLVRLTPHAGAPPAPAACQSERGNRAAADGIAVSPPGARPFCPDKGPAGF